MIIIVILAIKEEENQKDLKIKEDILLIIDKNITKINKEKIQEIGLEVTAQIEMIMKNFKVIQ